MNNKRAILVGAMTAGAILLAARLFTGTQGAEEKKSLKNLEKQAEEKPPSSLAAMGYEFKTGPVGEDHKGPTLTEKTRLVSTKDGSVFKFQGSKHYDQVAALVREEVYARLSAAGMIELKGAQADQLVSGRGRVSSVCRPRVFHTSDAFDAKVLLVIIQGSGAVRTGQWAQRLCVSNSLEEGTVLPYLQHAKDRGWGVLLLDPNYADKTDSVPQSVSAVEHVLSAWDALLTGKQQRQRLLFVAHSAGGRAIMSLLRHRGSAFVAATKGVAMTDAVHPELWSPFSVTDDVSTFLSSSTKDWVASEKPLGTALSQEEDVLAQGMRAGVQDSTDPIPLVSAGHKGHIWTSFMAMDQVFAFLDNCVDR